MTHQQLQTKATYQSSRLISSTQPFSISTLIIGIFLVSLVSPVYGIRGPHHPRGIPQDHPSEHHQHHHYVPQRHNTDHGHTEALPKLTRDKHLLHDKE